MIGGQFHIGGVSGAPQTWSTAPLQNAPLDEAAEAERWLEEQFLSGGATGGDFSFNLLSPGSVPAGSNSPANNSGLSVDQMLQMQTEAAPAEDKEIRVKMGTDMASGAIADLVRNNPNIFKNHKKSGDPTFGWLTSDGRR